nr:restriction endonuclease subunit S [Clostridium frigoris]
MTELGEIPENWEVAKLGGISEITMGQSPIGSSYNSIGEGIALLNGPTEFTSKYPIAKQWTIKPTKLCSNKDILFCVRGSSTGRMNIADDKYCIGRGLASIRGKEKYSQTDFIYQTMIFNIDSILSFCEGSTFPNISGDNLKNLIIAMPSLKEQQKIFSILLSVDEKIENTDKLIEKTKELKKGLMQRILTKGIGHDKFKDTEIGRIPEAWEVRRLGTLFTINNKSINPYEHNALFLHYSIPAFDETGNPVLQNGEEIRSNKFVIEKDSILVSKLNPRKKRVWKVNYICGKIQICSTEFINYNAISKEKIYIDFYFQYFFSDIFQNELLLREKGTTGSRKRVSPSETKDIYVVLPSYKEQVEISNFLSTLDLKLKQYKTKKEKLQELKKGLMQNLLTGKIRVKV